MPGSSSVELQVEKCVFGGDGLARFGNRVIFIPGTLPGERVRCTVTAAKKDFLRGRAEEILEFSPHRVKPVCPYAGFCPGCAYMHTALTYENELKNGQFAEFALRAGFRKEQLELPLAPVPETGYRNKLVLHGSVSGSDVSFGYVGKDNQTVFPVERCELVHPDINDLLAHQRVLPGFRHGIRDGMELVYRRTARNGVLFYRNKPPKGLSWLREDTFLGEISCPADGFFQVSTGGADALLLEVLHEAESFRPEVFLDLYCGAGLFSVAAAKAGVPVIRGADIAANSVAAARYNLKSRSRGTAEFFAGDAAGLLGGALTGYADRKIMAVTDPPRGGISASMRARLRDLPEESRLVYISCNPATWSRDAALLTEHGFAPLRAKMVNQFARTGHFEVFSVFSRKESVR